MCLFIQIFSICMLLNIYTHTSTELWYLYTKGKKGIKYNHISVIIDHKLNYAEYYINVITRRHKLLNNITPAIIFVWRSRDTSHLCLGREVCYYHFFNEEQKAHGEASPLIMHRALAQTHYGYTLVNLRFCYLWCQTFWSALYILNRVYFNDAISPFALHLTDAEHTLFKPVAMQMLLLKNMQMRDGQCLTSRWQLCYYVTLLQNDIFLLQILKKEKLKYIKQFPYLFLRDLLKWEWSGFINK